MIIYCLKFYICYFLVRIFRKKDSCLIEDHVFSFELKPVIRQATEEDLKQFEWLIGVNVPEIVFKVCQTPGRLTGIDPEQILSLQEVCKDLVLNIKNLTYAECMAKSILINYKENYSKFDLDLFFNMLEIVSLDLYMNEKNNQAYDIYRLTKEYKQRLIVKALIKENFMLSFLTALWKGTR